MRIFRSTTVRYGFGYTVFTGSRLLRDMVFAYLLGPEALGVWASLSIYRQYTAYSDLGLTNGLRRVLPKLLESRNDRAAQTAAGMAWIGAMALTTIFSVTLLVVAACYSDSGGYSYWTGIAALILMMYLDKHYLYLYVLFQSTRRVSESGLWMGALGTAELTTGCLLTWWLGIYGLYISLFVSAAIVCFGMMQRRPLQARLEFDKSLVKSLGITSLTLMGFGLVNVAIHNVDRVAILWNLGDGVELSHYHIAALLGIMVGQAPSVLLAVWSPEMFRFGKEDRSKLRRFYLLPSAIVASLGACTGGVVWLWAPWGLHRFLPAYWPVVNIVGWLVLGEIFFATTAIAQAVEVAMDRGFQSLIVRIAAVMAGLAGATWALLTGRGLPGVAATMCLSHFAAWLIVSTMTCSHLQVSFGRYALATLVPVGYCLAILGMIHQTMNAVHFTSWHVVVASGVFLLAFSPLMLLLFLYLDHHSVKRLSGLKRFLYWECNQTPTSSESSSMGVANS